MSMKQNKFIEKAIDWALNILMIIFGIVLLISIYTGIQTRILGNKYANFFGYSTFEVQTGSMEDAISAGDWIIVKLTQKVKLKDIITYELNGEYITHRVIEVYNGKYTTMGDANSGKDEPIEQKQIVGKVVKVLGNLGIIRKVLFNPAVLISFIITLFLFNLAIKKNKEKDNSKTNNYFNKIFNLLIEKIKKNKNKRIVAIEEPIVEPELTEEEKLIEEAIEDELAKTSLYRVIPVDLSEIDDTFLEIANNEIKETETNSLNQKIKAQVEVQQEEISVEEDDSLTKINLELLKNKKGNRKSKNIIDAAMFIKIEELDELLEIFLGDEGKRAGSVTIKNKLIDAYIDTKYYNGLDDDNAKTSTKVSTKNIKNIILESAIELINNYQGKNEKYSDMVNRYVEALILIANLEYARDLITDRKAKDEFYKKEIKKHCKDWDNEKIKDAISGIIKIQKSCANMLDYFLKSFETNIFKLELNKLSSKKNMYGAKLHHNISFSKVYSEYIIDKTYMEGIVAEDKIEVLLSLLVIQLVRDMNSFDFNKKYLLYIPVSLYTKEKKLNKILKTIDDRYAKNHIIILISIEDLLSNIATVKGIRKMGYRYALVFDKQLDISSKDRGNIYVCDYILINKKAVDVDKILSFIPKELLDNIIYEDMVDKVEDYGVNKI